MSLVWPKNIFFMISKMAARPCDLHVPKLHSSSQFTHGPYQISLVSFSGGSHRFLSQGVTQVSFSRGHTGFFLRGSHRFLSQGITQVSFSGVMQVSFSGHHTGFFLMVDQLFQGLHIIPCWVVNDCIFSGHFEYSFGCFAKNTIYVEDLACPSNILWNGKLS